MTQSAAMPRRSVQKVLGNGLQFDLKIVFMALLQLKRETRSKYPDRASRPFSCPVDPTLRAEVPRTD